MHLLRVSSALMTLFAAASLAAQTSLEAPDSIREQIVVRNATLMAAELRGDPRGIAEHYSAAAVIHATPPGQDMHGRDEIEDSLASVFEETRIERAELMTEHVHWRGAVLVESGRFLFQFRSSDGIITCERGAYVVQWRREADGKWRIIDDESTYDAELPPGPCPRP